LLLLKQRICIYISRYKKYCRVGWAMHRQGCQLSPFLYFEKKLSFSSEKQKKTSRFDEYLFLYSHWNNPSPLYFR
jgi:hypothetical protein